MKKFSIWWLLLLFIALGGTSWYLIRNRSDKTSIIMADRDFAVKKIKDIYKIFLADRSKEPITLEKREDGWYVNNKYKANPNSIKNLLETIRDIRMQSIPSKGHVKGIMEGLAVYGIKVEIYGEEDELLKTYYVGGPTQTEYGTYFYMEHGAQPYAMEIPHFVGNVRERYDLSFNDWRDRSVLDLEVATIEEVSVEYPNQSDASFVLRKTENQYSLFDFADQNTKLLAPGKQFVKNYLENFKGIGAEAIQNENPNKAEYSSLQPFCVLSIKTIGQKEPLSLKFIPIETDSLGIAVKDVQNRQLKRGSFFRMHVVRSDGDFLLVQYPNVEVLFKTKQDFMK
ncbi:MAG: DUF4340 domain-containing protein [Saprospiraceae bacterium]|nr:DUF4340 domain-containing protein [Saprospiraceae bacterium]